VTVGFAIEALGAHDRSTFDCGNAALNHYLRAQASQDMKRLVANCFLAIDSTTKTIAGYYTLAASSVAANALPADLVKRLPRYPLLPAALIGRLAVDHRFGGRGIGAALIADAVFRVLRGDVSALALIVDAKDDSAVAFYLHHGFQRFADKPQSLFLPLATASKLIAREK
jgi:GNAT superfamily N-acetyltransferase